MQRLLQVGVGATMACTVSDHRDPFLRIVKRHSSLFFRRAAFAVGFLVLFLQHSTPAATFAPGFTESTFSTGWNEALGLIVGRTPDASKQLMYVWERSGRVWIVEEGVRLTAPMLDISDEVAGY